MSEKRCCENCGNLRCANSIVAYWWNECVDTDFEAHWIPKPINAGTIGGEIVKHLLKNLEVEHE